MPTYTQGLGGALPEGIYDFVVADANDKQSQNGNDMIELQLVIKGPEGQEHRIYDNLVFTPNSTCLQALIEDMEVDLFLLGCPLDDLEQTIKNPAQKSGPEDSQENKCR